MEEGGSCSSTPGILTERKSVSTDRHRGEDRLNMKAEIKVLRPQAKACQTLPASHQNLEERPGTGCPLSALKRD